MSSLKTHEASGQALGYYYQLERAISWIAKSPDGSIIGIETEDDVVVKLSTGEKITEQDKSSVTTFPFNPSKLDLWKTLLIWLKAIEADEIDPQVTTFYLVTNAKSSGSSIVEIIGNATSKDEIKECIKKIRECINGLNGKVRVVANGILNYSDEKLAVLIEKIIFKEGASTYDRKELISDLQIVSDDDEIRNAVLDQCYGWLFNEVVSKWRKKEPALIERNALIRIKNIALGKCREELINEQIFQIGSITSSIQKEHSTSNYIKQLDAIKCDHDEKIAAICNYLNSCHAKTKMAKQGWVTQTQIADMENSLFTRWHMIFKKSQLSFPFKSQEDQGKYIYYDTMDHNAKIGQFETSNYFLTQGSYHELANSLRIGWHPDYKSKFAIPPKVHSAKQAVESK